MQILLKLHKKEIPAAHIMKRWTRDAKDVLPEPLKIYQKDQSAMHCKTYRSRLMDLQSVKLKSTGDTDVELFEVVMKHMRAAEKEAEELIAKRAKDAANEQVEDSDEEELEDDQAAVQSDGGVLRNKDQRCSGNNGGVTLRKNKYGASGSSAGYSDSEILGLKAPFFKRPAWRPRNNRFYACSEYKKKLWQRKNNKNKEMREQICGESGMMADNEDVDGKLEDNSY